MPVHVYTSGDFGAPTLNGQNGSLIAILKACLVDGFGAKLGAGWSIAAEDAANHKIILQNDTTNGGNGAYYRIRDDNIFNYATVADTDYRHRGHATIQGCESFDPTDLNITQGNFPNGRFDLNPDNYTSYITGCLFCKTDMNNATSVYEAIARGWCCIADERTCYFMSTAGERDNIADFWLNATNRGGGSQFSAIHMLAFGDFQPFVADPWSSFLLADDGASPYGTNGLHYAQAQFGECSYIAAMDQATNFRFINRSIEGGPGAVEYAHNQFPVVIKENQLGGKCYYTATRHTEYEPYPSPRTGGVLMTDIALKENTNAIERSVRHAEFESGWRGLYRGMKSIAHSLSVHKDDRMGLPGDTFEHNGRTYLLAGATIGSSEMYSIAFDITGPW